MCGCGCGCGCQPGGGVADGRNAAACHAAASTQADGICGMFGICGICPDTAALPVALFLTFAAPASRLARSDSVLRTSAASLASRCPSCRPPPIATLAAAVLAGGWEGALRSGATGGGAGARGAGVGRAGAALGGAERTERAGVAGAGGGASQGAAWAWGDGEGERERRAWG